MRSLRAVPVDVAVAAAGFGAGLLLEQAGGAARPVAVAAYAIGILVGGWRPALDGIRALLGRRLDVDLLMVVAAVAAAVLGQWRDASLLILIFATTGALEEAATERTAAGVRALLVDAPETAERLAPDGLTETVGPDDIVVGDRVLVRPGGRVPVDGTVVDGDATVDESSLTGEPLPIRSTVGRRVLSGSMVTEGALVVEATAVAGESALGRLAAAVAEAIEDRPPAQLFVERFEQRYSVGVVVGALLIAAVGPIWWGWTADETVMRTMTFLVVASPCAVVLATMPATLSALTAAARHRTLVRGGHALERLAEAEVAAFDKTGTLTGGEPRVVAADLLAPGPGRDVDTMLALAAAAERWSEHPIGRAIVRAADERAVRRLTAFDVELLTARGVEASVEGRRVRVGGEALVGALGASDGRGTVAAVEVDGEVWGRVVLDDVVRAESRCTVACLRDAGVAETWLLTGDRQANATRVAAETGVDRILAGQLPHEKASTIAGLRNGGRRVVYVGDGVNDAAALATASVGVTLAGRGSALAIDASDVVLMDDDLHRLADLVSLARRTRRLVRANLTFAVAAIAVLVSLDLTGRLPLVLGVMGHEGSSVVVALNGMRLLRWRPVRRATCPSPGRG